MISHLEQLRVIKNLVMVSEEYNVLDTDTQSQAGEKSVIYVYNTDTDEEMKIYVTTENDQHVVTTTHQELADYLTEEGVETTLVQSSVFGILGLKAKTLTASDDVIEVVISAKHFKSATTEDEADSNPLAQALKEKFNTDDVTTGYNVVSAGGKFFTVSKFDDVVVLDDSEYTINQLIKRARNKQGIGKFVVVLRQIN